MSSTFEGMLKEVQKTYDVRILEILGNGKKKYSEIREALGNNETGLLDKQLKILLDMETIGKTEPSAELVKDSIMEEILSPH